MSKLHVYNLESPRTGKPVANQFQIEEYEGGTPVRIVFQSYDSVIAVKESKDDYRVTLDEDYWDYSRTTGKYRNIFLEESKAETLAKIKNGTYKLAKLN